VCTEDDARDPFPPIDTTQTLTPASAPTAGKPPPALQLHLSQADLHLLTLARSHRLDELSS
jgi:hypothetical protein